MDPAHIVLLIGVTIAVAAIAGYLTAIALILKHVVNRLVTILAAVDAVTETAEPVGAVIDDINRDLAVGRQLIENGVERLEESRVPVGATAEPAARHAPDASDGGTATAAPPAPAAVAAPPPAPADPPPAPVEPTPAPARPEAEPPKRGRGWWHR